MYLSLIHKNIINIFILTPKVVKPPIQKNDFNCLKQSKGSLALLLFTFATRTFSALYHSKVFELLI